MNRINKVFFLFVVLLLILSCNKDESTGITKPLNNVTITMVDTFTVSVGDTLRINPVITSTATATTEYKYAWYAFTATTQFAADTLSKQMNLAVPVNKIPGTYTMVYEITDISTGIFYRATKVLIVRNDYTPGIMLLGVDNGKAVLNFLNTSSGKYFNDIYKASNGGDELGLNPISVASYAKSGTMPAEVLVLCKDNRGGVILDPVTFTKMRDIRNSFFVPLAAGIVNVTKYVDRFTNVQDYVIVNGKPCNRAANSGDLFFKPEMVGNYAVSSKVFCENQSRPTFYDSVNRRFMGHTATGGTLDPFPNNATSSVFDFNNVGLDLVYAGIATGSPNAFGLFKQPGGSQYYVLRMAASAAAQLFNAIEKAPMNGTNIAAATAFTSVQSMSGVLFYAAGSTCYVYNVVTKTGSALFDMGTGYSINLLKLSGTELRVGYTDANSTGKKAGFATYNITTVGGIAATQTKKMDKLCDLIIDITTKL